MSLMSFWLWACGWEDEQRQLRRAALAWSAPMRSADRPAGSCVGWESPRRVQDRLPKRGARNADALMKQFAPPL